MLQTALQLASRGLHIFPCLPRRKEPAFAGGFKIASADESMVRHWWAAMPDANIGVATGRISNLLVIDIDDAEAEVARLEAEHGPLPPTVEVVTSRGRHLYFQHPDTPVRTSIGKLAPGVDVKADGGYVIAPPSVHPSGKVYAWSVDSASALAPVPGWLLAKISEHTNGNGKATPPAEWRDLVAAGAAEGQRDVSVTKMAGHLLRRYIDPAVVLELLRAWNAARCTPPLPAEDVTRIVNSIASRELARRNGGHG